MLAKLPQLLNERGNSITDGFFDVPVVTLEERVLVRVRNVGGPGYYWTVEGFFMEELFSGNNGAGPVYADSHLVVTRTLKPAGLRFAGEIDITNSEAVAQSMRLALGDAARSHLDLSGLSFIDVSGIRAMVETASDLGEGRQVLLHGLPRQLQTVMRVTGWTDLPSLVLCDCGVDSR